MYSEKYRVTMSFEQQIEELRQRIAISQSDEEAAQLARQMRILLHGRIEELRGNVNRLSLLTAEPFVKHNN